jgi:hypothetical protein
LVYSFHGDREKEILSLAEFVLKPPESFSAFVIDLIFEKMTPGCLSG